MQCTAPDKHSLVNAVKTEAIVRTHKEASMVGVVSTAPWPQPLRAKPAMQ